MNEIFSSEFLRGVNHGLRYACEHNEKEVTARILEIGDELHERRVKNIKEIERLADTSSKPSTENKA